jgi:hypothetical protein
MSSDPARATLAAPARSTPWSAGRVIDTRGEQHPVCPPVVRSDEAEDGRPHPIAPTIIAWAKNCFAGGLKARPGDLSTLIQEASDAARNDFDEESAIAWAADYTFPPIRCRTARPSVRLQGDGPSQARDPRTGQA